MRRFLLAIGLLALSLGASPSAMAETLFLSDAAQAEVFFLPEEASRLADPAPSDATRLRITGAYSSGDRFAPEGMVIRHGRPTHPWPQGWDGLFIVERSGRASIHDMARVALGGGVFNLRERASRESFLARAAIDRISVIQSHLLIRNGLLDLRRIEGARTFRRRILFQTDDGGIGVYDTSPRALKLYDAALELQRQVGPVMALNLDMGAYDFCELSTAGETRSCGLLSRDGLGKLTNIVQLTARSGD
ncbi:MAG: succinate dehydrogenase [Pseudomonadota bacterium]